ncbi:hypothetical protein SGLAD_v1c07160 [Spiroplasma gladiatoris]|uniref:Uncharacterized protein n=1 Tax=Spiroplasma gladiatoris TaxID=2143 RepID=A0A4P7AHK8_9MOLU|nr:hypothetical protein [Spiroplasma gladiatoris]QBQ07915.1 hypothetical protein SGLAD_v1c07160 [Spiroplasma gladiatoris]
MKFNFIESFYDFANILYFDFKNNYHKYFFTSRNVTKFFDEIEKLTDISEFHNIIKFLISNKEEFKLIDKSDEHQVKESIDEFIDILISLKNIYSILNDNRLSRHQTSIENLNLEDEDEEADFVYTLIYFAKHFRDITLNDYKKSPVFLVLDNPINRFYNFVKKDSNFLFEGNPLEISESWQKYMFFFNENDIYTFLPCEHKYEDDYAQVYEESIRSTFSDFRSLYYIFNFSLKFLILSTVEDDLSQIKFFIETFPVNVKIFGWDDKNYDEIELKLN